MRFFIEHSDLYPEKALVLAHSLEKHHEKGSIEINYLNGRRVPHLEKIGLSQNDYAKFLVPELCNFEGDAIYLSNDWLCIGDMSKIELDGYASSETTFLPDFSYIYYQCRKLRWLTLNNIKISSVDHLIYYLKNHGNPIEWQRKLTYDQPNSDTCLLKYTYNPPWERYQYKHPQRKLWLDTFVEVCAEPFKQEAASVVP